MAVPEKEDAESDDHEGDGNDAADEEWAKGCLALGCMLELFFWLALLIMLALGIDLLR